MEVTVLSGQSFFDVALVACGSAEAAFELAFKNGLSVTASPSPSEGGDVVRHDAEDVVNRRVVDYYRLNKISPATAADVDEDDVPDGYKIFDFTFDYTFE